MTEPKPKPERIEFNDPDLQNSEQSEAGTQAQDVAADAQRSEGDDALESERVQSDDPGELLPDDTPDLIDHMNDMLNSGRIDMDAFEGEELMDDDDE